MSDRRVWICQEIVRDMERDVRAFDGRPLDGRTVAEIHATLAAAISALAGVVESLLPQDDRPDAVSGVPIPPGVEGVDPHRPVWTDPNNEVTDPYAGEQGNCLAPSNPSDVTPAGS